ncbi:uncharacterized protein LOC126317098 isoform X2 [Schistocerca gregaria]|uniref:uncharacterized protein LOC126317098 isoform X2 n=1 Tax=Schistocerca gregaria TaxID=7010 RepID=UPI00211F1B85|nr:uncharacterized protein LOC126317098 isoform X2 [Schistocerca gregaria]
MQCVSWIGRHKIRAAALGLALGAWIYSTCRRRQIETSDDQDRLLAFLNDSHKSAGEAMRSFVPLLKSKIETLIPISKMVSRLKTSSLDSAEKHRAWEDLKLNTFESTLLFVCSLAAISTVLCTTVSVVAKYMLRAAQCKQHDVSLFSVFSEVLAGKNSADSEKHDDNVEFLVNERNAEMLSFVTIDSNTKKRVLVLTDHYLKVGMSELLADIRSACRKSTISEQALQKLRDLESLVTREVFGVEDPSTCPRPDRFEKLQKFLLPPETAESGYLRQSQDALFEHISEEDKYGLIMNEVRTIMESEHFLRFFLSQLHVAFSITLSSLRSKLEKAGAESGISVAKLIPILSNLFSTSRGELADNIAVELFKESDLKGFMQKHIS